MFTSRSRYQGRETYTHHRPDGRTVELVRPPVPPGPGEVRLLGHHPHVAGQRLDHVAAHYLGDPTAFWRLADAASAVVPAMLRGRDLIPVPAERT